MRSGFAIAGVALIAVVVISMLPMWLASLGVLALANNSGGACTAPGTRPTGAASGTGEVSQEQMGNAAQIMAAAADLGLPVAAQILGVQCAYGESTLRVIDYGDGAGPDSRGLFQQRDNGAWGTYEDRMNPRISATNFFKVLQGVPGWEGMDPSRAINRVQRNADPDHYTKFRPVAEQIVKDLGGGALPGGGKCGAGGQMVGEPEGKWVNPLPGATLTSPYGPRIAPGSSSSGPGSVLANFHYGMDLSTGGGAVILAPTDLKIVVAAELDGMFGTRIDGQTLDGKLTIGIYHMAAGSLKVAVGDVVAAGTPLGVEGGTGNVTGDHAHIEFFVGLFDSPTVPTHPTTDPQPIFAAKGITW